MNDDIIAIAATVAMRAKRIFLSIYFLYYNQVDWFECYKLFSQLDIFRQLYKNQPKEKEMELKLSAIYKSQSRLINIISSITLFYLITNFQFQIIAMDAIKITIYSVILIANNILYYYLMLWFELLKLISSSF